MSCVCGPGFHSHYFLTHAFTEHFLSEMIYFLQITHIPMAFQPPAHFCVEELKKCFDDEIEKMQQAQLSLSQGGTLGGTPSS